MDKGLLLIISGPSGVGKGTVCRHLLQTRPELKLSVSTTTRPPRSGEREGEQYYFATPESFQGLVEDGAFLEWAEVHGHRYGTLRTAVEKILAGGEDLILEIDVQGAAQVRGQLPASVAVFLAPPSMAALEERITGRGTEDTGRINSRLETARKEMELYHRYDYLVVNDRVERAAGLIGSIIDAEKCRVDRGARPPLPGGENHDLPLHR